jgi:hypothetical protein
LSIFGKQLIIPHAIRSSGGSGNENRTSRRGLPAEMACNKKAFHILIAFTLARVTIKMVLGTAGRRLKVTDE